MSKSWKCRTKGARTLLFVLLVIKSISILCSLAYVISELIQLCLAYKLAVVDMSHREVII
jgi:hypothetical protein